MTKKIFLLVGIVVALVLAYSYSISYVFDWHFESTVLIMLGHEEGFVPSKEQITLLVCGIISAILLVGALIFLIKDFKTNKHWKYALFLAAMGAATIILSHLIINWLLTISELRNPSSTAEYRSALIGRYALMLVYPAIITTLMTLSYVKSRKELKDKNSF